MNKDNCIIIGFAFGVMLVLSFIFRYKYKYKKKYATVKGDIYER